MVDAPGRPLPRFPEQLVDSAAQRIAQVLDGLGAGPDDLAYTQGACGGDLLFTEACQARGVPVQWMQPFEEPEFIRRSVALRGAHWRARYDRARARLDRPVLSMPALAAAAVGDPFERCNQGLLERALAHGADRLRMVVLWNGEDGEGRGGADHLVRMSRALGCPVLWIDTRSLGA